MLWYPNFVRFESLCKKQNPSFAMNIILFDDPVIRIALLPFTFTRPVSGIRIGILTLEEKWAKWLNVSVSNQTEQYLQKKFPVVSKADNVLINGGVCPDENIVAAIKALPVGYFLVKDQVLLAANQPGGTMTELNTVKYSHPVTIIDKTWKIFRENANQLKLDFGIITAGRVSAAITDPYTRTYASDKIFIEEGVEIRAAILNAESGPIYLGKNSIIQEGAVIRGSFALCEGAQLNMGAKVRGDTTIGPNCKVGGEISNSVLFANSNKAHDGYLGNSVIGEWCNLGADTNTSNMKNNYDTVKLWSHGQNSFVKTDLQFCGLMMGDHSKCGINTMFNTGTVVDVCCNIFGDGYPRNYIPSFAWGGANKMVTYQLDKAIETASRAMARRNVTLQNADKEILSHIFGTTAHQRA
jgi:UDP-N-acetylglucosamine diphosphorylase/glucosamine-1-phosphate N-acetyltransferase